MKKVIVGLILVLVGMLSLPAQTVYEGFDYPLNPVDVDGESGGFGWSGAWSITGGSPSVVAAYDTTSLTNTAFTGAGFTPIGGRLANNHDTFGAERTFSSAIDLESDGQVYFSFLVSVPTTTRTDIIFTGSGTGFNSPFRAGLDTSLSATAGNATFAQTGSIISVDTTYFVVGKIETSAAGNEVMRLNIFEDGDTVPGTESFIVSSTGAASDGSLTGIQFFQGDTVNNSGNPAYLDEFRLGDTWESVAVPEPSNVALLCVGFVAMLLILRRRVA